MSINSNPMHDLQQAIAETTALLQQCTGPYDSDTLYRICSKAQEFVIQARSLCRQSEQFSGAENLRAELREQGYSCEWHDSSVWITLPLLLPKRGGDSEFITQPLNELLSLEQGRERFKECTIIYRQVYRNRFGCRQKQSVVRDSDNLEARCVQNVLERYLLSTDSSLLCTTVHESCFGEHDATRIIIFPGKMSLAKIREVMQLCG